MEPYPNHNPAALLVAEQIKRTIAGLAHQVQLERATNETKIQILEAKIESLEGESADYEARLRTLQEAATQFKLLASLSTGGGLLSLIAILSQLIK